MTHILTNDLKTAFAEFIAKTNAVKIGNFVLKSGKKSNIFFNFGDLFYGNELICLGEFFADFIVESSLQDIDVLFGPAYKGINITIATSIALYQKYGLLIPFAYNRKIEKDHAEGGRFVGYNLSLAKHILIIDDVITDGSTKYEAIEMLSIFPKLMIKAIIVGVDRQEKDASGRYYTSMFKSNTGIDVFALTTQDKVLECMI